MNNKEQIIEEIRLNRFIAMCGICSRRKADHLIQDGQITINGSIINLLGHKVKFPKDEVCWNGNIISPQKKQYILLNKPKGYITTTKDEKGRKEVMMLVKDACKERIVPVGRLDKDTTGLLLITNDGLLAKKLMHPKHAIPKTYNVTLDKPLMKTELIQIKKGFLLEDGFVQVDSLTFLDKTALKLELKIHIGRNRIVRRIFEFFNYEVKKLDRISYYFLNKDGLPQGKWRKLTKEEVRMLKKDN